MHGNVVDRIIGGSELLLYSKASMLVECYAITKYRHDLDTLVSCVASNIYSFSRGIEPKEMITKDQRKMIRDAAKNYLKKINIWRNKILPLLQRQHHSENDIRELAQLLRGAGPTWRANVSKTART